MATQIPASVRATLRERSQGKCEACGLRPATEAHHRQPRGAGGTSSREAHSPANLVHLCGACHGRVEAHRDPITGEPADTYALGLHVQRGLDVTAAPVRLAHPVYGAGWWWLNDDGTLTWHDPGSAPWSPPRRAEQLPTHKTDPRVRRA